MRPFRPGDEGPVVSIWNATLTRDPITVDKLTKDFNLDII